MKMKKLLSLLLALMMIFALAACNTTNGNSEDENEPDQNASANQSDFDYVSGNGEMIIGYTHYAPMNYLDENGDLTGFDIELATIVCEKLGVKPEFLKITWETKEVELKAKTIDCIWNGLTIDDERKENMELTQPYLKNAQVVLMKADADYDGTASLTGKTMVAEQGSAGEDIIKDDENMAQATYVAKKAQTDCLLEVKAGTADAAVLDLVLAQAMTGEDTNYSDLKIMERLTDENFGVAFRKGSDIAEKVNQIFDELIADGTMVDLAEKYGLELSESK